jgi:hypothetical protein
LALDLDVFDVREESSAVHSVLGAALDSAIAKNTAAFSLFFTILDMF